MIIDVSNPITLLLLVLATALLIFLAQEVKKSYVVAIPLFAFLIMLVGHVVQVSTLSEDIQNLATTLYRCIAIDFIFILITFFA